MPDVLGHMPPQWLLPDAVFDGSGLQEGVALRIENGRVAELRGSAEAPGAMPVSGIVTPGYVDLQVNGGGGVLLNQTPTPEGMAAIAAAHRRFGTVAILPTVITDAPDVLPRAAETALAARGQTGIAGLHIEGPHISKARRGTHAARYIRDMDEETLCIVSRLRQADIAVMITVAPEAATPRQIAALAQTGAVVSLGHSDADAETTRQCLAAGASCFTHLFNAMSPLVNRAPGMTGAAINSTAYAGIICDGVHVADELVAMAIRARPVAETTFLVSDAMPTVGGPDVFDLYGTPLHLHDNRLVNAEGSLAGAHVTMAESVARLVGVLGLPVEAALRMAITIPARVIGQPHLARLEGRGAEDILVLAADMGVQSTLAGTLAGLEQEDSPRAVARQV